MQTLRIALALAAADLRGSMQYRANFIAQIVVGVVWQCTGFLFLWVVLSRFNTLAGWTLGSVAFLYALRLSAHALDSIFFLPLEYLSWQIRQGEVDRYLVRPLPPLLQIITSHISLVVFGDTLSAVILLVAATTLAPVDWSPVAVLYLVLAMIGGALIESALKLIAASLAFRALNTDALGEFIDSFFATFGNYPLKIYGPVLQSAFTFVLPLAFVAYFPAAVLVNRTGDLLVPALVAYLSPLVGVLWFAAAYWFFNHELRCYQSSGH
jgi:ABC-2 type transport system permease protein